MTFAKAPGGRDNNLTFLRFICAITVLYSHSFPLTGNGMDIMKSFTGGEYYLGHINLAALFFYGGFLNMRSLEKRGTPKAYFRSRALRIFPQLWIMVLGCVLVLGPLVTTVSLGSYFSDGRTAKFLLNGLLIPVHPLPGVFEHNPFKEPTVNGSLWSMPVEAVCYVACWLFAQLGFSGKNWKTMITVPLVFGGALACSMVFAGQDVLLSAILPILFFYIGMLFYLYRDRIPVCWPACLPVAAAVVVSLKFGWYRYTQYILLPYLFMHLAFATKRTLSGFCTKYELSYGIYLAGWPVQQLLCMLFPGIPWYWNFLGSAAICPVIALGMAWADRKIIQKIGN